MHLRTAVTVPEAADCSDSWAPSILLRAEILPSSPGSDHGCSFWRSFRRELLAALVPSVNSESGGAEREAARHVAGQASGRPRGLEDMCSNRLHHNMAMKGNSQVERGFCAPDGFSLTLWVFRPQALKKLENKLLAGF